MAKLFSLIDLGTGAAYKPDRKNPAIVKTSTKDFSVNNFFFCCRDIQRREFDCN